MAPVQPSPPRSFLGYRFRDPRHLAEALRHASAAITPNNERLEFLGDRVLGLVVAAHLHESFPRAPAGELHARQEALVNRTACAEAARRARLGQQLILGRGEQSSGGRDNERILADAIEAVIAAVFLDGGMDPARRLVHDLWRLTPGTGARVPTRSAKSRLQEWAQARGFDLPEYKCAETDPGVFTARVRVACALEAGTEAKGSSRRLAETEAAEKALAALNVGE